MAENAVSQETSTTDIGRKQPAALWTLASTELWERFSFYGLLVILTYYIYYSASEGGLGLSDVDAFAIAGAYGGAVYLAQPVGAWLADRLIPARTLVFFGAIVIMAGHITLALAPGLGGLLTGLTLIVLGTGALFPNILAMLNLTYEDHSPKRDFGFTLYYTAVLIGALIGPIVTGFLQVAFGFHIAFAAAAFGMLIALLGYALGRNTLPQAARRVPNPLTPRATRLAVIAALAIVLFILALVFVGILTVGTVNTFILVAAVVVSIVYFAVMHQSKKVTTEERTRVVAYVPLFVVSIVFWTLILQLFTTFAIYADTRVDLTIGSITVPAAYISTFEVIAAIIAGPIIAAAGQRLARRNPERAPGPAVKLTLSLALMTITFALFAVFPLMFNGLIPLLAVIIGMVLLGVTEVTFAPIFFSATGNFAPKAFNAQMMALAGLTLALAASLSGFVGQLFVTMNESLFFALTAAAAAVCGIILLSCRRLWTRVGIE